MDTHVLGTLHQLHRRLHELTALVQALHEEVKEIRQTGVAINFGLVEDDGEEDEDTDESGEGSTESEESATTWP